MTTPQRIVRKYHIEAMSNGYSLKILGDPKSGYESADKEPREIEHYVAGGTRAGTKPETLRKRIIAYAVGELRGQLEKALDAADNSRPEEAGDTPNTATAVPAEAEEPETSETQASDY